MTQENPVASSTRVRPALVAGGGELPVLIARQASRLGVPLLVYCTGDTAPFASIAGVEAMPLPAGGLDMSAALREKSTSLP